MNLNADWFFKQTSKWKEEYSALRMLILDCGLKEELKWGCPCYTFEKQNIVLIHGFKNYCALLFMQGALLKDQKGILVQQTVNVQSARQIRFTNKSEIIKNTSTIKSYIKEAVSMSKSGIKIELKKTAEYPMPEEFLKILDDRPDLKTAFQSLTPGRQRGYLLYFSVPKQSKTRESRIKQYLQYILDGKGLKD